MFFLFDSELQRRVSAGGCGKKTREGQWERLKPGGNLFYFEMVVTEEERQGRLVFTRIVFGVKNVDCSPASYLSLALQPQVIDFSESHLFKMVMTTLF